MKVLSFSIWGKNPIYHTGMFENMALAPRIYPGWKVRVYYDAEVPKSVIHKLQGGGCDTVFEKNPRGSWDGLFWRFYPAADPKIEAFVSRDADSRLTVREKVAVDEWMKSDKGFHVMRDHWNHNVPIMGGMWGCKRNVYPNMINMVSKWKDFDNKGTDQIFLQDIIWPAVRETTLAHDRYQAGFFKLPNREILYEKDVYIYNKYDNCGFEDDKNFPRGKIVFKDGRTFQRLDVYHYDPNHLFGEHEVRPFPSHAPLRRTRYVGESSQDFGKIYDPETEDYIEEK